MQIKILFRTSCEERRPGEILAYGVGDRKMGPMPTETGVTILMTSALGLPVDKAVQAAQDRTERCEWPRLLEQTERSVKEER